MFNQQYQPQQNQTPYLQPVGNPNQGDSLDQASRLIDLVEKIAARQNGAGNLAPGTSQYSPVNAGQFQSRSQEELAAQELALRSLSNGQQEQGSKTLSAQDIAKANTAINNMANAFEYQQRTTEQVSAVADSLLKLVNRLSIESAEKDIAIKLGLVAKQLSEAFLVELDAAHRVIDVQNRMLRSPLFMLDHSFALFNATIQPGDTQAIDLISSYYLELVRNAENRNLQSYGKYSPQYSQYLESQMNPSPQSDPRTIQYQRQENQALQGVIDFAQGLNDPDFARNIRRAHVARNLSR